MSAPTDLAVQQSQILKASNTSNVESLAARVANAVYEGEAVAVRAIGAGAVNQAAKACAIATTMAHSYGHELSFVVGFDTVTFEDNGKAKEWSAVTFRPVETRAAP